MSKKFLQRWSWPGLGLSVAALLMVQTGAVNFLKSPRPLAASPLPGCATFNELSQGRTSAAAAAPQKRSHVAAEGRVVAYPGAEVIVGSEVAGRIVDLPVCEKSPVRKGELIAQLAADDLRASQAEAEARIFEAQADERYYERELKREQDLVARRAGTAQNLDTLRHSLDASRARRAAAVAVRDHFAALVAKTRIVAPLGGVVTARHVQPGETIEAAAKVVTIVDLDRLRVEAEVDEYDTARVALGAPVAIVAEGYPTPWRGQIEEIPDAVVGRKLRPEDPGRPIDARVLPVKIHMIGPNPLKLGQRVEVLIAFPFVPDEPLDQVSFRY
jgi:multidrug efflux pump subunit AcrA (membrane-fusion protein)